ncbi:hypothetical protein CMI44_00105 [Candidatus Pacearchaeota archaeon]|nr:hypothetical protein [Candidatus Pacearchaeota archaeon]
MNRDYEGELGIPYLTEQNWRMSRKDSDKKEAGYIYAFLIRSLPGSTIEKLEKLVDERKGGDLTEYTKKYGHIKLPN